MKIWPEWPVAIIALRVIHANKRFAHCGNQAKRVAADFSDKLLANNALRMAAAPPKGPLSYVASLQLAREACQLAGCAGDADLGNTIAQLKASAGGNNNHKAPTKGKGGGNGSQPKASGGAAQGGGAHGGQQNARKAGGGQKATTPATAAGGRNTSRGST